MSFDLTNQNISDTFQNLLQQTGSDSALYTLSGNMVGDLRISGSLIAENYIISSSVTYMTSSYMSGSTQFGDSVDDIHSFTGSIHVSSSQNTLEIVASSSHGTPMVKLIQVSGSNSGEFLHMVNHQGFPAIQFNQGYHGQCSWHMYGSGSYGGNTPVLCHQFQDASSGADSFVNYSAGSSSTNYFGINTNDPTTTLTVKGDISASGGQWLEGNLALGNSAASHSVDGLTVQGSISASGDLYVDGEIKGTTTTFEGDIKVGGNDIKDSGGTTVLSFDGSGNIDNDVTIKSSTAKLTLESTSTNDVEIDFRRSAGTIWKMGLDHSESEAFCINQSYLAAINAPFVIAKDSKNVGIGTIPSDKKLTVAGDISASGDIFVGNDETEKALWVATYNSTFKEATIVAGTGEGADHTNMGFYTKNSVGSPVRSIFISGSGDVGIGTITPSKTLTVEGDISASGDLSVQGDITGSQLILDFDNMPTSDPRVKGVVFRVTSGIGIYNLRISAG